MDLQSGITGKQRSMEQIYNDTLTKLETAINGLEIETN
jgi:hypothetical protein